MAIPLGSFYVNIMTSGTLASGGTYNLTGLGGTQVGPFSASAVLPSTFTAANYNSITRIDRTQPLTISWTGSGFDRVYFQATTNTRVAGMQHIVTINCYIPANLGTYSIPTAALAYLQPGTASIAIEGMSPSGTFTANLVAGGQLDLGLFVGDLGVVKSIPVQ
jgi:hypothetical protein